MEGITVRELIEASGGQLLRGSLETPINHVSIDSRVMKGQDLFVPLIGEQVDAHRFLEQAVHNGAAAVFTSEHVCAPESDAAWIGVRDTKKALQDVGAYYRRRLNLPLVGVTGSVGKTTTREMISAALAVKYRVYKTPGNQNSQVGVPITMTEISSRDELGVIELGMSEPGELTVIARIAQVDMAVITNIGVTHIEQLGSQENICREKLSIQDGLKPGGILFLNGDDPWLEDIRGREGITTIYYGTGKNCQYRAEEITLRDGYPSFTAVHGSERIPVTLKVMGLHQVLNAMVSLAVADMAGVPMADGAAGLLTFTGFDNRQQVCQAGGITLIDDTYNASPVSMKAALDILVSMKPGDKGGRRIAVLGDMKELGEDAPRFHYEIGEYLSGLPVDLAVVFGELAQEIKRGVSRHSDNIKTYGFHDKAALITWLDMQLKPGDCVLFKASNSMKLGEVAEYVRQHHH